MESKPKSTLERIEHLELKISSLEETLVKTFNVIKQVVRDTSNRVMSLESATAALAKTTSAVMTELMTQDVVSGDKIYENMIKFDADTNEERVQQMLNGGLLKNSDAIGAGTGLIVISRQEVFNYESGESKHRNISNYEIIELGTNQISDSDPLYGKKVGDTVEVPADNPDNKAFTSVIVISILGVYEFVSVSKDGE